MHEIICGNSLQLLEAIESGSVNTVITSPPYYNQRNYQSDLQIGQENNIEGYIKNIASCFTEILRILKDDGTLWLNLGDKYVNGELLGVPWRVCLSLKSAGWILHSDIIWNKPNAMPSSVKTRPTTSHEYIFLFSKSNNYTYNADSIREPHVTFSNNSKMMGGRSHFGKNSLTPEKGKNQGNKNLHDGRWNQAFHPLGRNKRTVWEIPTSKFKGSHFAVFPEKLVETCLLAGSNDGDLVLDPFCGSGTVGVVAKKLKRNFIGIDCNFDYCKMARNRIESCKL